MKSDPKEIIAEALQLEPAVRAMVAETLLESLDLTPEFSVSEEWMTEIRRRCNEIDSGKETLIDNTTVIAELRGKYP